MDLEPHITAIEAVVGDARTGLPEPVFELLCRMTPMVNVDLLIRNQRAETLLTWRQDALYHGWHVPGGIVRFKERMADRIAAVARLELGASVDVVRPEPVAVNEIIQPVRLARGHFISFLFECRLTSDPNPRLAHRSGDPAPGQWAWHAVFPQAMIDSHEMYRKFIEPHV
jgi:colanic acid biosynthesis protein WcaH